MGLSGIHMETLIANLVNSALVIALLFLIFKRQDKRMDSQDTRIGEAMNKVDAQPSSQFCIMQHQSIDARFRSGDAKFEKLEGKIDALHDTLSEVNTNVALLCDREKKSRVKD